MQQRNLPTPYNHICSYYIAKEFDEKCVYNQESKSSAEVTDISMLSFMLLAIFPMLNYKSTH